MLVGYRMYLWVLFRVYLRFGPVLGIGGHSVYSDLQRVLPNSMSGCPVVCRFGYFGWMRVVFLIFDHEPQCAQTISRPPRRIGLIYEGEYAYPIVLFSQN